ncbi:lipopolysaccharide heptosyltransferase I [Zeimonas arvi]|uniref:Lipopolysaccharide heptosyltransferase 1 n=1 Tax=Zeimonas arvi TaxID=2498847 RepID=A0A5C8P196_9BURK|nr:lipopolysaccharide heptosyltransferase I [Zeimonas arvi]TXL67114.1 lipopolysaccharide heptosyltransferase I [Zeimonas arvi]
MDAPRVLLVKLTSLGDVIKALPVIDDIRRALPGTTVDWVVERPVDSLLALHPGIATVIPLELRRYRKEGRYGAALRGVCRDFGLLRARRYDCIVDLQGRRKSAIVAALARGPVIGPAPGPSSEPMYHRFYRRCVGRALYEGRDAISANRILAAQALGYPMPSSPPRFGLRPGSVPPGDLAPARPFAVLVHGSSKPEKTLAEATWIELGNWLSSRGLRCLLPWGDAQERARAQRLADAIGSAARVPQRMPSLTDWVGILAQATVVAGVDSGITHLAAASGAPTVAIFTATSSATFRIEAETPHRNLGDAGRKVALAEIQAAVADLLGSRSEPGVSGEGS